MALLAYTVDVMDDAAEVFSFDVPPPSFDVAEVTEISFEPFVRVVDLNTMPVAGWPVGEAGLFDQEEQVPQQYIRGMVIGVDGYPVARTVVALDRETGARMAVAASGEDGVFLMRPRTLSPVVLVAIPLDGEQINAVVLDNIQPVPE